MYSSQYESSKYRHYWLLSGWTTFRQEISQGHTDQGCIVNNILGGRGGVNYFTDGSQFLQIPWSPAIFLAGHLPKQVISLSIFNQISLRSFLHFSTRLVRFTLIHMWRWDSISCDSMSVLYLGAYDCYCWHKHFRMLSLCHFKWYNGNRKPHFVRESCVRELHFLSHPLCRPSVYNRECNC